MDTNLRDEYRIGFQAINGMITAAFESLAFPVHQWMKHQGFWESANTGEKLMLVVSELGEAIEADRHGDAANFAEELGDAVVRILDLANSKGINLGKEIMDKMMTNLERPRKHGKGY